MEQNNENKHMEDAPEQERYVPRPAWQVWSARLGLVVFLLLVVMQILHMAGGGL